MTKYEQMYFRIMRIADKEKTAGAEMFMHKPDRWWEPGLWRCENNHVSSRYLRTEPDGSVCLVCRANVVLTFPEDQEGPLQEPT